MKFRILLLSILSFLLNSTEAQKSFEKGYIIKSVSHDTIWGLIDNRNWSSNPKIISFKLDGGSQQRMGIYDIDEFAVKSDKTTEIYRKKILDIDKGRFELDELKNYPTPLIYRDTVFATLYESGRVNLYYLRDETNRIHYLVEKNDTGIQDLEIQRYIDGETRSLRSKDFYKSQLNALMNDCGSIITKINDLTYKEQEMRKLVAYYNSCIDGDKKAKYTQAKEKVDFFVAALLGVGFRMDKISFAENNIIGGSTLGPSPNLDIDIDMSVVMPRTNKHVELGFELGWGYFRESKTYNADNISVLLAPQMLRGGMICRYLIPVEKIKLAFSGGFSIDGVLASVNQMTGTGYFYGVPIPYSQPVVPLADWHIALILGAGVRLRDFNIEMRYYLNSSLAYILYSGTYSNSLNLTVYYAFFNSERKHKKPM